MRDTRGITLLAGAAIAVAAGVVGWRWHAATQPPPMASAQGSNTAVLGGYGQPPGAAGAMGLPRPPAPAGASVARVGDGANQALAAWIDAGHVVTARFRPDTGWVEVRALEDLAGEASDLQLAGNGHGTAMAVWRHTLGRIDSLRFARWQADTGWSAPDVVPRVLPRQATSALPPRLVVDARGNATLEWPSAFDGGPTQVSRWQADGGWSAPEDQARAATAR